MCGRFTLTVEALELVAAAQELAQALFDDIPHRPRYNVAPPRSIQSSALRART